MIRWKSTKTSSHARRKGDFRRFIGAILILSCAYVRADLTVYSNCFEVTSGSLPHVVCTAAGLDGIDFAIDKCTANDGWQVTLHFTAGDDARIENAKPGTHLVDDNITNRLPTVTGNAQPYVFVFYNWYRSTHTTWYGYVSLGLDENSRPVVLDGAVCNAQNVLSVTAPLNPAPASVEFTTIDHGDWLELGKKCIPGDTRGWVAIPAEINGKSVRVIGYAAFADCQYVTGITVPEGIESIGENAFAHCLSLTSLTLPSSVTNVGNNVIAQCEALRELHVGAGLDIIGEAAFMQSAMTNLVIDAGVEEIGGYAFAANSSLRAVSVPCSVKRIAKEAFNGCGALTSVSVPWATEVEDGAFPAGCAVTRYGPNMYAGCDADDETKCALMRTLDWRDYADKTSISFEGEWQTEYLQGDPEPGTAGCACAHLGISPSRLSSWSNNSVSYLYAFYKMPSVEFLGIDPERRTLTGRVVPAPGTRIVAKPLRRVFGFYQILTSPDTGETFNGDDWGHLIGQGIGDFTLDFSDYVRSNGIFRITYPATVLEEKGPQSSHLFRLKLSDKTYQLW